MYNMLNVYTKCIQVCIMFNHVYTLSNTCTQGYSTDIPGTRPNILGIYQILARLTRNSEEKKKQQVLNQ